jgi:hypothetical protein
MTGKFFIEHSSLEAVRHKCLFYPSAGHDWSEPLHVFADYVDEFWFVDIAYNDLSRLPPVFADDSDFQQVSCKITGTWRAQTEQRLSTTDRKYRHIDPGNRCEEFERARDGRRIVVNRRRGFGQYALVREFADDSIGVFMHRGDSPGEGGSNVYYLANRTREHEPCSNLLEKVSKKLAERALIISDGSNVQCRKLKRFHRKQCNGAVALEKMKSERFCFGSLNWRCVGHLQNKYGPTLVWEVTPADSVR